MKQNLVLNIYHGDLDNDYTACHRGSPMILSDSIDGIYPTQDYVSWVGLFLTHSRSFGAPHPGDNSWMRMYDVYAYDDKY